MLDVRLGGNLCACIRRMRLFCAWAVTETGPAQVIRTRVSYRAFLRIEAG